MVAGLQAGARLGSKLRQVVEKTQAAPDGDRLIGFVQFKDLSEVVAKALKEAGIDALPQRQKLANAISKERRMRAGSE